MKTIPFLTADHVAQHGVEIVDHLRAGGLIAYPTETVYGFGGLVRDDALSALTALKSRDPAKPFLLLIRHANEIPELKWTPDAIRLAEAFWPGPLTLALAVQAGLSPRILSEDGTVAVRATSHEPVRALLERLGEPITSTSANTPGDPPAASAGEARAVVNALGRTDVLILDGGTLPPSEPSTLVDCSRTPPRVLRAGAITVDALLQVVGVE